MAKDSSDTAPEGAHRVYTRGGDDGSTGLLHGGRVAKDSAQSTACGDADELQACIGLARAVCRRSERSSLAAVVEGSAVVPYLNRLSDLLWTLARWQDDGPVATRSVPADPSI